MALNILVVDDQKSMCWILSKVLAEAGFSVETAPTGREALSILTKGEISAAIIDYRLPDMNGIQLFEHIKRVNSQIPSILITSYGSKAIREHALRAGFGEYFDKPFRNKVLVAALGKLLT